MKTRKYVLSSLVIAYGLTLFSAQAQDSVVHQPIKCPIGVVAIPIISIKHERPHGPVHQISVDLRTSAGTQAYNIKSFHGLFHGPPRLNGKNYTLDTAGDISRPFGVTAGPERAVGQVTSWTGHLQSVDWLEFDEIIFMNGAKWHASEKSKCEFIPEAPRDSTELPSMN